MLKNQIEQIPELPQEIIRAVDNNTFAVFIGAGVSRIIGCTSWYNLADNLIESCFLNSFINFKEKETLHTYDPKKAITICQHIFKKNEFEEEFLNIIKKALESDPKKVTSFDIYRELHGLRGLFVTTNADNCFQGQFERLNIAYKQGDFEFNAQEDKLDNSILYQIHGSLLDPSTLVFTVPQYLEKYKDRQFTEFMLKLFSKYVILFVGYGLDEFEVLDYLVTKFDSTKGKEIKHFILLPYYRGENRILEFDQYYYSSLGITVVPYEKDENGYNQLYEVLKAWNSEVNQVSTYLYSSFGVIEEAINNFNEISAINVFQIIKNDKPQRLHFFKKLAICSDPFPWLEPLYERGYFDPKENPFLQKVPGKDGYYSEVENWDVLGYLKNLATKNAIRPSNQITTHISHIIDTVFEYRNEEGKRVENYYTDSALIKIICKLPKEIINEKHIRFIESALDSKLNNPFIASDIYEDVFPFLIYNRNKDLLLKLLDVIFKYKKSNDLFKYSSIIEEFWLNRCIDEYKKAIIKLCGIEASEIIINKIEEIVCEDKTQFGIFPIMTIEDDGQSLSKENYESLCVSFVRDIFQDINPDVLRDMVPNLLSRSHSIFKRIAVHTISYHYDKLNKFLWSWNINPLNEYLLKHEIYELFRKNCLSFSKSQIETIICWIESAKYYEDDLSSPDLDKYLAYKKKSWLLPLLQTHNPEIVTLYEKYNEINPAEIESPNLIISMESFSGNVSPIEESEFLIKPNNEIAGYLKEFKEEMGLRKPCKEGLAETLRKCVSKKPDKFTDYITPFLNVPEIYQHSLLWGLTEAWKLNRNFSWNNVFTFISKIIDSEGFWNRGQDEYNYRNWIVSQISDLIDEGLRKEHTFEFEYFTQAENILLILAQNTDSDLKNTVNLEISVLNSLKGNIFSSLINYSMRFSQLSMRDEEKKWKDSIKSEFNNRLDRSLEPSIEFSFILGEYISYLYYLDKEWTRENINRIFLIESEEHWKAAFTGYLLYASQVYDQIYSILRKSGHYKRAILTQFEDPRVNERLIQHICLGYIEGWERLDDDNSLISLLLVNPDPKKILEIVRYFKAQKGKLTKKISDKIKPLWESLYNELSSKVEDRNYQIVASSLSSWISLIDCIDEQTFEWIKFSARYMNSFSSFFKDLVAHAQKAPYEVGMIYLEILNNGYYPYYYEENTKELVRILYERKQKIIADKICNLYGTKGRGDFLKDIYKEYNSSI